MSSHAKSRIKNGRVTRLVFLVITSVLVCCVSDDSSRSTDAAQVGPVPSSFHKDLSTLRRQAAGLLEVVEHEGTRRWLRAVWSLPEVEPRTFWWSKSPECALSPAEYAALSLELRRGLVEVRWGTPAYYAPLFDTPLAYARPVDVLAERVPRFDGLRVLDFGYGGITQLALFARVGAYAVGVDVSPVLAALYRSPTDQGPVGTGSVQLIHGSWPGDAVISEQVGAEFDVIVSRNVLKRGYVHPQSDEAPVTVDLGVADDVFLAGLFGVLEPGGVVLVYNLGYASEGGAEYRYWEDIATPFPAEAWRTAGFDLLVFDGDDSEAARVHASHYNWHDDDPEGVRRLVATFTLAQRPR